MSEHLCESRRDSLNVPTWYLTHLLQINPLHSRASHAGGKKA